MCQHRQRSSLVPIVMRARSYSGLSDCPTSRVSSTWYSGSNRQDLVPVFALAMFPTLVQR